MIYSFTILYKISSEFVDSLDRIIKVVEINFTLTCLDQTPQSPEQMTRHLPLIHFLLQLDYKRLILRVQIGRQEHVLFLQRGILIQMHGSRIAGVIVVHPLTEMISNVSGSGVVSSVFEINDDEFLCAVDFQNVAILQLYINDSGVSCLIGSLLK